MRLLHSVSVKPLGSQKEVGISIFQILNSPTAMKEASSVTEERVI